MLLLSRRYYSLSSNWYAALVIILAKIFSAYYAWDYTPGPLYQRETASWLAGRNCIGGGESDLYMLWRRVSAKTR